MECTIEKEKMELSSIRTNLSVFQSQMLKNARVIKSQFDSQLIVSAVEHVKNHDSSEAESSLKDAKECLDGIHWLEMLLEFAKPIDKKSETIAPRELLVTIEKQVE